MLHKQANITQKDHSFSDVLQKNQATVGLYVKNDKKVLKLRLFQKIIFLKQKYYLSIQTKFTCDHNKLRQCKKALLNQ